MSPRFSHTSTHMHKSKPPKAFEALSSFGTEANALSKRLSRARRRQTVREALEALNVPRPQDILLVWHSVTHLSRAGIPYTSYIPLRIPHGFPLFWVSELGHITTPEDLLRLQRLGDEWETELPST